MSVTSPPTRLRSNSSRQKQTTKTLNAIAKLSLKLEVVLLQRNSKQPGKFGGGGLDKGHTWETTQDVERVREHIRRGGNIGFICGPHTDLMVLDIDDPERFKALVALLGEPGRPWVETGSGKVLRLLPAPRRRRR